MRFFNPICPIIVLQLLPPADLCTDFAQYPKRYRSDAWIGYPGMRLTPRQVNLVNRLSRVTQLPSVSLDSFHSGRACTISFPPPTTLPPLRTRYRTLETLRTHRSRIRIVRFTDILVAPRVAELLSSAGRSRGQIRSDRIFGVFGPHSDMRCLTSPHLASPRLASPRGGSLSSPCIRAGRSSCNSDSTARASGPVDLCAF